MAQRKKGRLDWPATGTPVSRRPVRRGVHPDTAARVETGPVARDGSIWGSRRVLLLNATYEPLTALPMRRAVVMLMCGKADVVHDDRRAGHPLGDMVGDVPSVIRLRSYVRVPYRARIPMTRAALMHRDRFRCAYCGGKADTIDHVVPRSRGGDHTWENCVPPAPRATTGRPTGCCRSWAGRCVRRRRGQRVSTGGCCRRSRSSTRRG